MSEAVEIPLTQGKVALVSPEDAEWAQCYKWHTVKCRSGHFYAVRRISGTGKRISMHRELMSAPDGLDVDHINGDGLDNRRANLRICTRSQNLANRCAVGPSGYIGVHSIKGARTNRWRATIRLGGKNRHIGIFATAEEAARAYDREALAHRGKFARLNFPVTPLFHPSPTVHGEGG